MNAFYVFYGNRIGLLAQQDAGNTSYLFTTNIGNSVAKGFEAFVKLSMVKLIDPKQSTFDVRFFNSLSYTNAKYKTGEFNKAGVNTSVKGNFVENTPEWTNKTGITLQYKAVSTNLQFSYTSSYYNDAFNTEESKNGVTGKIPAYGVWDWNFYCPFLRQFYFSGGVNNLTNKIYFNRRITMYPGPGILPADGRTFYISFGIKT